MVNIFLIILIALMGNTSFDKNIKSTIDAIQKVESEGNSHIIGDTFSKYNYSVGLGQIRLKSGVWIINKLVPDGVIKRMLQKEVKRIGVHQLLLDPIVNTYLSRTYFKWLTNKRHKGKIKEAIISYNTGQNAKQTTREKAGMVYYWKVIKVMRRASLKFKI